MLTAHFRDAAQGTAIFRDWKFVDAVSFVRLLWGGNSRLGQLTVLAVASVAFLCQAVAWWKSRSWDTNRQRLLWACTLTATLVVNVYVGIYDTVLVVIAALLTADARTLPASFKWWLVALYVTPWFSQELARVTGVQLYTVVLAGFAVYQFRLAGVSPVRLQSQP